MKKPRKPECSIYPGHVKVNGDITLKELFELYEIFKKSFYNLQSLETIQNIFNYFYQSYTFNYNIFINDNKQSKRNEDKIFKDNVQRNIIVTMIKDKKIQSNNIMIMINDKKEVVGGAVFDKFYFNSKGFTCTLFEYIAVDPKYRGNGYGKMIYEHLLYNFGSQYNFFEIEPNYNKNMPKIKLMKEFGYAPLNLDYTQPPISTDKEPEDFKLFCNTDVPKTAMETFLYAYFRRCFGLSKASADIYVFLNLCMYRRKKLIKRREI